MQEEVQEAQEEVETEATQEATQDTTQETAKEEQETVASGNVPDESETESYWPDDWRQSMAKNASAGDEEKYEKLLKQLERYGDPSSVYSKARELESRMSEGNTVKVPGEDATEEELKAWNNMLGVPEEPNGYIEQLQLPEGDVLGEDDMPVAESFAEYLHAVGAPPDVFDAAIAWYFDNQEANAAYVDENDDKVRYNTINELKEEYGPKYNRLTNAIPQVFSNAPGGTDFDNENALINRLLGGRMSDGTLVGDDPDMVRWLVNMTQEVHPMATIAEDANMSGQSVDSEIASIEKMMRTDRDAYFKDTAIQQRYVELLEARERHSARA
jgi:hypothetical protein